MSQRGATTWFDFLVPPCCLGCGDTGALRGLGLCEACQRRLRVALQPACRICGRSLGGGGRCGSCTPRTVPYQRLLAGWLYLPPCDRVIRALKFRGLEYLGGELAQSLAERYRAELADCDLVVPVPLHWGRRWRRGYNQAEKIASPLARALGLAISPALRR